MKNKKIFWLVILSIVILTACSSSSGSSASGAVTAVNDYFNAFAARDEEKMSSLICPDWETDAYLEYDSFQATETKLEGLSCRQSGSEGDAALVTCEGKIMAKYVDQTQEFDLSQRVYRVEKTDDQWQVCGYSMQ